MTAVATPDVVVKRGPGRPPLSAEEKAKRLAERIAALQNKQAQVQAAETPEAKAALSRVKAARSALVMAKRNKTQNGRTLATLNKKLSAAVAKEIELAASIEKLAAEVSEAESAAKVAGVTVD